MKFPVYVYYVDTDLILKGNGIGTTPVSDSTVYTLKFDLAYDLQSLQILVVTVVGGKSFSTFTSSKLGNLFSNKKQAHSATIRHGYYGDLIFLMIKINTMQFW